MDKFGSENLVGGSAIATRRDDAVSFYRNLLNGIKPARQIVNWARKWSFFQYPFVTACCAMEYMAVWGPRHDIARFGAEFPRFTPRQSDLLFVVGTVTHKQAPVLKRTYESMSDPKWVIAFGVCASSGGFYNNYSVVQGIDNIIPVDVYIPGCPPRPEAVLDALMMLQDKVTDEQAPIA